MDKLHSRVGFSQRAIYLTVALMSLGGDSSSSDGSAQPTTSQPTDIINSVTETLLCTDTVISAEVTSNSSGGSLSVGQTGFSLTCQVSGTENLTSLILTHQWRNNSRVVAGQEGDTLSFSPLTLSDAGAYNCSVSVSSSSLTQCSTVTVNSTNTVTVAIQSE